MNYDSLWGSSEGFMDVSGRLYVSVRLSVGVFCQCRPSVLRDHREVLEDLESDLRQCFRVLPKSVHSLLRRTKIWVNDEFIYGPLQKPILLRHLTTHHHESWLEWARDTPHKVHGIEIYSASEYRRMRLHWNGCGLLLHEICHLIHQHVLGLENPRVQQDHRRAEDSGLYENMLRRDWVGKEVESDLAYAMVDYKEFFAELSVAYLSCGYPELDKAVPSTVESCCPVLMEPKVISRVLESNPSSRLVPVSTKPPIYPMPWLAFLAGLLSRRRPPEHCNKFYPFTCGQLKCHDPQGWQETHRLWQNIADWHDPENDCHCCKRPIPIYQDDTVVL